MLTRPGARRQHEVSAAGAYPGGGQAGESRRPHQRHGPAGLQSVPPATAAQRHPNTDVTQRQQRRGRAAVSEPTR